MNENEKMLAGAWYDANFNEELASRTAKSFHGRLWL